MVPDRLAGLVFVVLAACIAVGAYQFYVPYQYEPLGPSVFPYLVAASLCVAGGFLVVRPDSIAMRISSRHVAVLMVVLGYAYLLEPLGYPVTTVFVALMLGLLLGLPVRRAGIMALLLALATYALLVGVLGLNLPMGWVWANIVRIA